MFMVIGNLGGVAWRLVFILATYEIPQIQCKFFDETFEYQSSSFIVWVVRDLDKVCPQTRFRKTHDELIYVGDSNACEKIEDVSEDCRGTSGAIYR